MTLERDIFINSYQKLYMWIKKNKFSGFDPYDALNSQILNPERLNKNFRLIIIHLNKNLPVNLRKYIHIPKTIDNEAASLITRALLQFPPPNCKRERIVNFLINHLYEKSLKNIYGYHCWNGHNFPIQTLSDFQTPEIPGIFNTINIGFTFMEYYKRYGKFYDVLLDIKNFILDSLYREFNGIPYFVYKPISKNTQLVYNASAFGFIYLLKLQRYIGEDDFILKSSYKFFKFLVSKQHKDGAWAYSIDLSTKKERWQIDFHQGFILDTLQDFIKITQLEDKTFYLSFKKGLLFYKNKMFLSDGRSFYRYPKLWPIDILNQAQGIITFSKASNESLGYLLFAKKIAYWTIKNMQDPRGYFYYQRWPFFINKIPYMRWGQAWMMLALATLLNSLGVHYGQQ